MSLQKGGRIIRCDGLDCTETTHGVVALRPTRQQQQANHDWLFTSIDDSWRHYCPRCAHAFLVAHMMADGIVPRKLG